MCCQKEDQLSASGHLRGSLFVTQHSSSRTAWGPSEGVGGLGRLGSVTTVKIIGLCGPWALVFTGPAEQGDTVSWPSTGLGLKGPPSSPVFLCSLNVVLWCLCLSVRPELGVCLRSQHVKDSHAGEWLCSKSVFSPKSSGTYRVELLIQSQFWGLRSLSFLQGPRHSCSLGGGDTARDSEFFPGLLCSEPGVRSE